MTLHRSLTAAIIALSALATTLAGCTRAQAADHRSELPLPAVPDSITAPALRADYVLTHFWDDMDFANTAESLDTAFMEQAMANYAQIMHFATPGEQLQRITDATLAKAAATPGAYMLVAELAKKYLYEHDSPLFHEQVYSYFATALSHSALLSEAERSLYAAQLSEIAKCAPGNAAPDVRLRTAEGQVCQLSSLLTAPFNALVLYEDDCEHCQQTIHDLDTNGMLAAKEIMGTVNFIAIDMVDDENQFLATAQQMPVSWTSGYDLDRIFDNDIYVVRGTPAIYLIDCEGVIILKDASINDLISFLSDK